MKHKVFLIVISLFTFLFNGLGKDKPGDPNTSIPNPDKICGIVLDKISGEPLVGVKVIIEGSNKEAYTNFDGKFEFSNLTPGEYSISCNMVSYESYKKSNIIIGNEKNNSNLTLQLIPVLIRTNLQQDIQLKTATALNVG